MIDLTCEIDEIDYELFDVHESFRHLNDICFDQSLSAVVLSWSKKMTVSAGRCRFKENRYCEIILSEPILKYRSAKECEETLLHEMIHAYLFLTKKSKTLNAHGKDFIWHMNRVNDITGLNVDIYHNFIDEVEYNRRHVWRCSGPCQHLPPYFGYIRRSRNLTPGPNEKWWHRHQYTCGGTFRKLASPLCR